MLDENWTNLTSKDIDIPAFLENIERMKSGGSMACPFCGGTVRMVINANGRNEYACETCDMKIDTEAPV